MKKGEKKSTQLEFSFMAKPHHSARYAQSQVDQWVKLTQDGLSYREIGERCSVPWSTVAWKVTSIIGSRKTGRKKLYKDLREKDVVRNTALKKAYGIDLATYNEMLSAQEGLCAICSQPPKGGKTSTSRLHVDHDHVTKAVRQLLCSTCNTGVGSFSDDPTILEKAAEYLRVHGK